MAKETQKTYRFSAGFGEAEVGKMRQDVAHQLHEASVAGDASYALINVLDEFCCNMMEHSGASWVEIQVEPRPEFLHAVLKDDGAEFDAVEAIGQVDPAQPAQVNERRLGLYMIGLLARDLEYRREGSVNRLEFNMKR